MLAGGTDRWCSQAGLIHPGHLLVGGLGELRGVHVPAPGRVRIGALTSHRQLATDPASRQALPALATAASTVGGWQTQVAGTIGGNLANASPAADTPPALLIAGATVHLGSRHGTRSIPIDRFIRGRRDIDREPDELVVAVECDTLPGDAAESISRSLPVRRWRSPSSDWRCVCPSTTASSRRWRSPPPLSVRARSAPSTPKRSSPARR